MVSREGWNDINKSRVRPKEKACSTEDKNEKRKMG